jgi:Phospholipase_D-nuclease N-terminal/Short C-terminal domain
MAVASDGYPLADLAWTFVVFFGLLVYSWLLITVLVDVFRRPDASGWSRAGWILLVVVLPLAGVLAYVIVQGRAMAERAERAPGRSRGHGDGRVRTPAATGSDVVDEIARGKQLLDAGAIDQDEYEQLKRRVLV